MHKTLLLISLLSTFLVASHTQNIPQNGMPETTHQPSQKINNQLIEQLATMVKKDQEVLIRFMKADNDLCTDEKKALHEALNKEVDSLEQEHFITLKAIITNYGWPGFDLVGEAGECNMSVLVLHCEDLAFQKECLELVKAAVALGNASKQTLAYLTDRTRMRSGEQQIYGSQFHRTENGHELWPVEDPDNLDTLRATMDLEPIADYEKRHKNFNKQA